jgi:hypothetical protein
VDDDVDAGHRIAQRRLAANVAGKEPVAVHVETVLFDDQICLIIFARAPACSPTSLVHSLGGHHPFERLLCTKQRIGGEVVLTIERSEAASELLRQRTNRID